MKPIFLSLLACGAALLTGCETVAVVDRSPYYRPGAVYYDSGRPYYYTSGVRYWGYPRGYSGSRYSHVEVDRDVTNNYYVDRRTVVRKDGRTAYRGDGRTTTYRGDGRTTTTYRGDGRRYSSGQVTTVKTQPRQQQYTTVKKKKVRDYDDD